MQLCYLVRWKVCFSQRDAESLISVSVVHVFDVFDHDRDSFMITETQNYSYSGENEMVSPHLSIEK